MEGMKVTKLFKRNFELMARKYGLLDGFDRIGYGEFKAIVNIMLVENPEFTVKWVSDNVIGLYDPEEKIGVIPYTGGTEQEKKNEHDSNGRSGA